MMERREYKKILPQLEDDLNKFSLESNLTDFSATKKVNIKQVIYRSITLFISALGRSNNVLKHSSFDIINELKGRKTIDEITAQNLSLAVAIACHVRMVHYASKKRQDDIVFVEDEMAKPEGGNKVQELTKIVPQIWLVKCLATTKCLHALLRHEINANGLNRLLSLRFEFEAVDIMHLLGLDRLSLDYSEHLLTKFSSLSTIDCCNLLNLTGIYARFSQYEKCLDFINTLKSKMRGPYQAINDTPEEQEKAAASQSIQRFVLETMKLKEAENLFSLKKFARAGISFDELLRDHSSIAGFYVSCSVHSAQCRIALGKHHEALSRIRDLLKAQKRGEWRSYVPYTLTMLASLRLIAHGLAGTGRKDQALHWAKQALNFVKLHDFSNSFIASSESLIEYIKTDDSVNLEKHFFQHI